MLGVVMGAHMNAVLGMYDNTDRLTFPSEAAPQSHCQTLSNHSGQ